MIETHEAVTSKAWSISKSLQNLAIMDFTKTGYHNQAEQPVSAIKQQ